MNDGGDWLIIINIIGIIMTTLLQEGGKYIMQFNKYYSLSDGGGWSKMKVSFSVSSQSILKRFS